MDGFSHLNGSRDFEKGILMPPRSPKTTTSRNRRLTRRQPGAVLDLFAGAGGWEVALAMLGLKALGIETDPHACATAQAAGHERLLADVTKLDPLDLAPVWGLVGSPPCQAYSSAGKGLGRQDKPIVIACAHELAAGNDSRRAWQEGCRDPRSLLSVEPLRYIIALRPRWVALEQVPAVLELWSVFAALLAQHGYQSVAGVLSAERYGVPQTRKRAFLIASLDGPVGLPAPTHRSYNPRRNQTPEDELALLPWVSMAEALGWGMTAHPAMTVLAGNKRRRTRAIQRLAREQERGARVETRRGRERGGWAWRNGNQPNSAVRHTQTPAPTVFFGRSANKVVWVPCGYDARQRGARPRPMRVPRQRCSPKADRHGSVSAQPRLLPATGAFTPRGTRGAPPIHLADTTSAVAQTPSG